MPSDNQKKGAGSASKEYEDWFPADDERLREIVAIMEDVSNEDVLEVAMKYGLITSALACRKKVGLDIEMKYLKGSPLRLKVRGDAFYLPFKDGSFDVVIFTEILEHLPGPETALREIYRVARRGFVLSTPNNCMARRIKHRMLGKSDLIATNHVKEYSWAEVKAMAEACGFELKRFHGLGFFATYRLSPLMRLLGRLFPRLSSDIMMVFEKRH